MRNLLSKVERIGFEIPESTSLKSERRYENLAVVLYVAVSVCIMPDRRAYLMYAVCRRPFVIQSSWSDSLAGNIAQIVYYTTCFLRAFIRPQDYQFYLDDSRFLPTFRNSLRVGAAGCGLMTGGDRRVVKEPHSYAAPGLYPVRIK